MPAIQTGLTLAISRQRGGRFIDRMAPQLLAGSWGPPQYALVSRAPLAVILVLSRARRLWL